MMRFVQKLRIGCFSLVFMLAMAIPRLVSAQTAAVLVKTFDISAAGPGPRMRIGDLNGDGRIDFLLCDATDDNPSYVAMLTAYDGVTGTMMWQVGSGGSSGTDRDEPCQIVDIDNDGYNEVLAAMSGQMNIYNGADGKLKSSFALPSGSAHDCIMIANFSANPIPMDIVVKDRYGQVWAMTNAGKLLWTYTGITGHYNVPFDVNGDGRDEFFTGYSQLDYQGKAVYPAPINIDHPDNIWVGEIDGDTTDGLEVVYGLAQPPSCQMVSTKTGKVMWTNGDMTESQQLLIADYIPSSPGLEIYGLDRTVRSSLDSLFIIDSTGKTVWKESGSTNGGGGTAIKPINNWDGTNAPMVLAFKRGAAEIWNGQHAYVYKLGMDGNAVMGDLAGDSKTEVLMYSQKTANVYAIAQFDWNTPAPNPGHPLKQTRQNYNWSRYGSSDEWALTAVPGAGDGGVVPPTGGTTGSTGGATGSTGGTTGSTGGATGSTGGTTGSTGGRGGTTRTGGTTAAGGTTGTGGTTAAGGTTSAGGSTAAGGAMPATGGSTATGGTIVATGGTTSTGGVPSTGGTVASTGGSPNVSGGVASGGTPSSGGAVSTGGIPGSGGTTGSPIAGAGGTAGKKATGNGGGCSCRVVGQPSRSTPLASLAFLGLIMLRSLRRRRSR